MYKDGHLGINALVFAPVAVVVTAVWSVTLGIIGGVVFVGLASLPDIDRYFDPAMGWRPQSERIPFRERLLHRVPISHRGITHTVWFAVLVGGCTAGGVVFLADAYTYTQTPYDATLVSVYGFFVGAGGVCAHLLGDAITPAGIAPFAPVTQTTYSYTLTNAKNKRANTGLLITGVPILGLAYGFAVTQYVV